MVMDQKRHMLWRVYARVRYSAAYLTDTPEEALLSEGSRTKCARRDRKVPRESLS